MRLLFPLLALLAALAVAPAGPPAQGPRVLSGHGDNVYSVVTQAFTGRARVVTGKPELPRS